MLEDIAVELSRLTRDALECIRIRMAAQQLGEAFGPVEHFDGDRRHHNHARTGLARRLAA